MIITEKGVIILDMLLTTCKAINRFPGPTTVTERVFSDAVNYVMLYEGCDHEYCTCESECEYCRKCGQYLGS